MDNQDTVTIQMTSSCHPCAPQFSHTGVPDDVALRNEGLCHRSSLPSLVAESMITGLRRVSGTLGRGSGILLYHRTAPNSHDIPSATWNVTPTRFRDQLTGLLSLGYQPLRLDEWYRECDPQPNVSHSHFAVTFDDGYQCVYEHAFPILQELGIPATVFVATAYLDDDAPFPFDDWPAVNSRPAPESAWRPLTTRQCDQMLASGLIDLGSHTHSHQDFRGRTREFHDDLTESTEFLERRFGIKRPTFSFPYGVTRFGFAGGELAEVARETAVTCALSTDPLPVNRQQDPFTWGRITPTSTDTATSLATTLDPWRTAARNIWRRWRCGEGPTV